MKLPAIMLLLLASVSGCAPLISDGQSEVVSTITTQKTIPGKRWAPTPAVVGDLYRLDEFAFHDLKTRPIDVWLPADYFTHPEKSYPVIYMHDGQNLFDGTYSHYSHEEWGIDETMTRLIDEGTVKPAIIVGIWSLEETRFNELMPQRAVTQKVAEQLAAQNEQFDQEKLLGDRYAKFLVEDLKPYIDEHFRTKPDQSDTFVMGSSMGGLMSCALLAEYPDIFGGAGCLSTHWPIGQGAVLTYFEDIWPQAGAQKVYFDFGTETLDADYEPYQKRMDALLDEKGFVQDEDWITRKFEGEPHSETAWKKRVHIPLTLFLQK